MISICICRQEHGKRPRLGGDVLVGHAAARVIEALGRLRADLTRNVTGPRLERPYSAARRCAERAHGGGGRGAATTSPQPRARFTAPAGLRPQGRLRIVGRAVGCPRRRPRGRPRSQPTRADSADVAQRRARQARWGRCRSVAAYRPARIPAVTDVCSIDWRQVYAV